MTDNKVVHAFPTTELPPNLLQIEPRPAGMPYHCQHGAIRIDAHDRTVQCADCTAALDPFDFLLNNAVTLRRAWENHRATTHAVAELNERLSVLKKEEKRLRAMVKRLNDKVAVVDVRGKSGL